MFVLPVQSRRLRVYALSDEGHPETRQVDRSSCARGWVDSFMVVPTGPCLPRRRRAAAATRAQVRERVGEAVRKGALSGDTDIEATVCLIYGFLNGISTLARDGVSAEMTLRSAERFFACWGTPTPRQLWWVARTRSTTLMTPRSKWAERSASGAPRRTVSAARLVCLA